MDELGGPKFENMYHAGWAWAGSTPYQSTKLVAAHFGGTRNPSSGFLAQVDYAGQGRSLSVPSR